MPNLVIVIPFTANPQCDLDQSATEMQQFFDSIVNHQLGMNVGTAINNIVIVHEPTPYQCSVGDYVLLFAHGAKKDSDLSNNQGQVITMDNTIAKLTAIGTQNTARLLCMCCFSSLQGHVGSAWKNAHTTQETYGGDSAISNLYSSTRTQIRKVCAALFEL
jgi:hypothetical protein